MASLVGVPIAVALSFLTACPARLSYSTVAPHYVAPVLANAGLVPGPRWPSPTPAWLLHADAEIHIDGDDYYVDLSRCCDDDGALTMSMIFGRDRSLRTLHQIAASARRR